MAVTRSRGLPAILLAAAACLASLSAIRAFVGSSQAVGPRSEGLRGDVALRAKLSAKEKQAARAKERQGANDKAKKIGQQQWPVEIPEGVTVLHLEYGEDGGIFPQPGNEEVVKFFRAINGKFGSKVRIIANYEKALEELSPTKTWRNGAFEIVDIGSKSLLYSKLASGVSLMNGKEEWVEKWMSEFGERIAAKAAA